MSTPNTKMRLWDQFKTTDPNHTKKVDFGRKFTSIDAHWQIMRMTEVLGPIGESWGYRVAHSVQDMHHIIPTLSLAVADVTIWWLCDGREKSYGPVRGLCPLTETSRSGKVSYDDDAAKKAMTDALTKGLSHMGVSADVFLGLFDDNKYVNRVSQQFAAKAADAPDAELPESVKLAIKAAKDAATPEDVDAAYRKNLPAIEQMDKPHMNLVVLKYKERKAELKKAAANGNPPPAESQAAASTAA